MPHARVRGIDASAALAMEGVVAILTDDDVPEIPAPGNPILTNTPHFVGEPVAALAAVDETIAQDAIRQVELDLEPLPFVLDPLESLRPDGPNARLDGNTVVRREGVAEIKWTDADFAAAADGELPMGEVNNEWSYGDLEAGFRDAAVVLDESFRHGGHLAPLHGAALGDGVLAEREVPRLRVQPEPERDTRQPGALHRDRAVRPGLRGRVLRRRIRVEGERVPGHVHSGAHGAQDG